MYLKSLFYFQETAIKWQIVLSTWRNRILKDIWFRNKAWWLSWLPLPEPLRSPISPCDFLWAYFPYHNSPWLFHACKVVSLKGKASCPLSPFPSSSSCPCLPAHHWPHKISLGVPLSPGTVPLLSLSGVHGVSCLYWNQFSTEEIRVAPTQLEALQTHGSRHALLWGGLHLKCVLLLSFPSLNVLCKSQAPLYSGYDGRFAQITTTTCSDSV